jgi:hypothetical protein
MTNDFARIPLKNFKKNSIHLSIALFLIAYIWFIESHYGLKILNFGPKQTLSGQDFNLQPSGKSALWFKVNGNISKSMHLRWDDHELNVSVNFHKRVVSVYIPKQLYKKPGKHTLYLINNNDKCYSNKVEFNVVNSNILKSENM